MKKLCLFSILLFIISITVLAQTPTANNVYTIQTVPNDHLLDAHDYVTNPDGIISPQAEAEINNMIALIEDSTTAKIAVVLLHSIGDLEDIDDFGTNLFMHWGIGQKENDNGLLFLLVYDKREMIFRTGYGLEGVLPDIYLNRIIKNDISPKLKEGDFDAGIIAGMQKVSLYLTNPDAAAEITAKEESTNQAEFREALIYYLGISFVVFFLFLLFFIFTFNSKKSNYDKYKKLEKGKGFAIFCTVFFPAFMIFFLIFYFIQKKTVRNKPFPCSRCNKMMHKLTEITEDAFLDKSQQLEEQIKSVDYDVWLCDNCGNKETLRYDKFSHYTQCPHCKAKTYFKQTDYIISRATTLSSGVGERVYACKNCGSTDKKRYTIPRIVVTSSNSSRGGGFGGGGGGSWGGGSTGGGGARGGW